MKKGDWGMYELQWGLQVTGMGRGFEGVNDEQKSSESSS